MKIALLISVLALTGCVGTPESLAESICKQSKNCHVSPGPVYGPQQQRVIEADLSKPRLR